MLNISAPDVRLAGVDGCKAGWYALLQHADGALRWQIMPTFHALLITVPAPGLIAIDVPIGLLDRGTRPCDTLARQALRPLRSSSVFAAPLRPCLAAATHSEASAMQRAIEGKGMSIQTFNIMPKIREVDAALQRHPAERLRVFEVHPEISFAELNERRPMPLAKKSADGRRARQAVLQASFGDIVERFLDERPRRDVQADDVLDAFAALWSARRIGAGEFRSLPSPPEHDALGIRMSIFA